MYTFVSVDALGDKEKCLIHFNPVAWWLVGIREGFRWVTARGVGGG